MTHRCAWLDGERGSYRQCEAVVADLNRSYCPTHHAVCYVKPQPMRTPERDQ